MAAASSSCCAVVVVVVVETYRDDVVVVVVDDGGRSWRAIRMDVGSTCCWPLSGGDGRRLHGPDAASGASSGIRKTCAELLRPDVPTWRTVDGQRRCSAVTVGLPAFGRDCEKWDSRRTYDVDAASERIAGDDAAAVVGGDPFCRIDSK